MLDRMPRLCLNMIVKNETKILERCLLAALPFVSCYAVLDTGSTDDTIDIFQHTAARFGVPGVVLTSDKPFDFKTARNDALEEARKSSLDFTHLLLCDADMSLVVSDRAKYEALLDQRGSPPAWLVKQTTSTLAYDNVRIVRRDAKAEYVKRTHEYLSVEGVLPIPLPGLYFLDYGDGASRSEKYARDVKLLQLDIQDDPDDPRGYFYLAETHRYSGEPAKALPLYRRRTRMGGFEEERWYAQAMVADCLGAMGLLDEAIAAALLAFEQRPERAEPLVSLAKRLREKGRNELSALLALRAGRTSYPSGDSLFVERQATSWGPKQELAIAGFYSRSSAVRDEGREACMSLSVDAEAPGDVRSLAWTNTRHWAESVEKACPSWTTRELTAGIDGGTLCRVPLNPSIARTPRGFLLNLRHVNYTITEQGSYDIDDDKNVVRTENQLIYLDARGEELSRKWIRESREVRAGRVHNLFNVQGWEDLRLFVVKDDLYAIATTRDRNLDGNAQMALLRIVDSPTALDEMQIDKVWVQPNPRPQERLHQKNWLPLVTSEGTFALYGTRPTVLMQLNPETMLFDELESGEQPGSPAKLALDEARGGSQVVEDGRGGFVYVTHDAHETGGMRRYTHRVVRMNGEKRITSCSDPFHFGSGQGIEFCAGLATDATGFERNDGGPWAFVSYGSRDARAFLGKVRLDELLTWGAKRLDASSPA